MSLVQSAFYWFAGLVWRALQPVWDPAGDALMGVIAAIPLWGVRAVVIATFIGMAVWAMSLPRAYAFKGAPAEKWYYDVRLWAVLVLACEILPYVFF